MPEHQDQSVSIIIATTAEARRAASLRRALASCTSQDYQPLSIYVIVNGAIYSPELVEELKSAPHIHYLYNPPGSLPEALYAARQQIASDFFCFLDDDDVLLPGSIRERVNAFCNTNADVVVSNGYVLRSTGKKSKVHLDMSIFQQDPLMALFSKGGNWLASCAGMFRARTIGPELFADYAKYAEWTYLGTKLALSYQIKFINAALYQINYSPDSLSGHANYSKGLLAANNRILALPIPEKAKILIKRKIVDINHAIAYDLIKTSKKESFIYHLNSLKSLHGLKKYFLFTRYYLKR